MSRLGSTYSGDKSVEKFYAQRFRLWKKFDEGIFMTPDGWYSVTMEEVASQTAERLASLVDMACGTAVDLFCGCGGNAIQLARRFPRVVAVDLNPDAIEAARVNAVVYGVADKIRFVVADVRDVAAWASDLRITSSVGAAPTEYPVTPSNLVIHASPPWGGVWYMHQVYFDVERDLKHALGMSLCDVLTTCWTPLGMPPFAMFLPRTILVDDVGRAAVAAFESSASPTDAMDGGRRSLLSSYPARRKTTPPQIDAKMVTSMLRWSSRRLAFPSGGDSNRHVAPGSRAHRPVRCTPN